MNDSLPPFSLSDSPDAYRLAGITLSTLTETHLARHGVASFFPSRSVHDIQPLELTIDQGLFSAATRDMIFPTVVVYQTADDLFLTCSCAAPKNRLCEHQALVLSSLLRRRELRAFFDPALRHDLIKPVAREYGLENEPDPDAFFDVIYEHKSLTIKPKRPELLRFTDTDRETLVANLLAQPPRPEPGGSAHDPFRKWLLVFTKPRYSEQFCLELWEAPLSQTGTLKNPLTPVYPLDQLSRVDPLKELKFYSALARFQHSHRSKKEDADLDSLRLVVDNPAGLDVFYHDPTVSENLTVQSLQPIHLKRLQAPLHLTVVRVDSFYELTGWLTINGFAHELHTLSLKYDYFLVLNNTFYLIDAPEPLRVIRFFSGRPNRLLIHASKFEEFRLAVLSPLENRIRVQYADLPPATPEQLAENSFTEDYKRLIYLEDSQDYVNLTPVLTYGRVEVPVLSEKEIYSVDSKGKPFRVERDTRAEEQFLRAIVSQHPDFQEQLENPYVYLHQKRLNFYLFKKQLLDENWFLMAFEAWREQGIEVLGFNALQGNRLNAHPAKVSVMVNSGLDWFETDLGVSFGKNRVSLKHLQQAVKNRSRFVTLDDGTMGLLPAEWLDRFSAYFQAGEIVDDRIHTPKIRFSSLPTLYNDSQLSTETREQLTALTTRFVHFNAMPPVSIPDTLRARLRDYQKAGVNWLNFLDELGFGGCLADDMGLGKTLQIIAFLLIQQAKNRPGATLIVVPTSLLFNWQAELTNFAPSLTVHTFYGANRVSNRVSSGTTKKPDFDPYDVVLTSYGTVVSSVNFLKKYQFNYVILDESQAIKNPESQRYRAVRQLPSRNRLVLTGTPIENHTFDLYGQLSFACPGLLGDYHHFKAHYSTPIDKFDDRQRARELQQKISPFILRRTKTQVAPELPEKTEMLLFCEMGPEQRKVYNAYEQEFRQFLLTTKEGDIPRLRLHVLQGLTKLRQICDAPVLLNDAEDYGDASAKIDVLIEQIETKSPQHKILVFSQFVSMLELIRKRLDVSRISYEYLTGQTTDRATRINRFQADDAVRVFLISLKAGGTGLNLTRADYVYLVDPWWNPAVENQAIDRVYRIGQQKNVVAVRLICPDTIEEKMLQLQETKKERADQLVKTDAALLKTLNRSDLLNLLQNRK
ncbi:DEAD/DEAH box helicase [Larkinella sp. VNQ87]|uniref:DEAD/DEAH box helicase n=1 Tax=Larkinella sp. VNQ87 TaxID=3400921 RepID=UPI003C099F5C